MQFKSLALFAAAAAACPQGGVDAPGPNDKFGLIAIRSGSPVQNTGITASKGNFLIGGKQDASCDPPGASFATFYLKDGEAYLYAASATPQQLYVDRSGMGQGLVGYTTGAQPTPRNGERKGFSISDKGYLVFDGESPVACPGAVEGGYSFWFTSATNPAGNENCIGVALRAIKADKPVSCSYSG